MERKAAWVQGAAQYIQYSVLIIGVFRLGNGFLPDGIFQSLYNESHKHRRSYRMLMLELIRDGLERHYAFKCSHDQRDRKYSKKAKVFYCKACGVFFERVLNPKVKGSFEFRPLVTTWELERVAQKPLGPLEVDLR